MVILDPQPVRLRMVADSDIDTIYQWYASGEYPAFFRHYPSHMNAMQLAQVMNATTGLLFAIIAEEFIGYYALSWKPAARILEPSLLMSERYQGRDYAFTAFNYGIAAAQHQYPIRWLRCCVLESDGRTQQCLKTFGFTLECTTKETAMVCRQPADEQWWRMSMGQWTERYGGIYG